MWAGARSVIADVEPHRKFLGAFSNEEFKECPHRGELLSEGEMHVNLGVPKLPREALERQGMDAFEEFLPEKLVGLLRRYHTELPLGHALEERPKLRQIVREEKPSNDAFFNRHLSSEDRKCPDVVVGNRATDIGSAEGGDAENEENVRELLLFLASEGVVDFISSESKAVFGGKAYVPSSFSEEAAVELDVEATDWTAVPVQQPIVRVGPRRPMILDAQNSSSGDLIAQFLEAPFGEDTEQHLADALTSLAESFCGDLLGIGSQPREAFSMHPVDEGRNASALEPEVSSSA